MSESEFEETQREYAAGNLSRRRFIGRMVAAGVSMTAAVAFADSASASAAPCNPPNTYGHPPQPCKPPHTYGHPPDPCKPRKHKHRKKRKPNNG
jgi:hypothetical protein